MSYSNGSRDMKTISTVFCTSDGQRVLLFAFGISVREKKGAIETRHSRRYLLTIWLV